MTPGVRYRGDGTADVTVWAPFRSRVEVILKEESPRIVPLQKDSEGYWHGRLDGVKAGARYVFRLNESMERPDPASGAQPDGVHAPSAVVDHHAFVWEDRGWQGIPLEEYVLYELHAGTFSPEGTFDAVIPRLAQLKDIGITAIELMPVAQFPGERNWGYDGVYLYAAQNSYGGPDGLKRLVNACHRAGLAVVLDVVYNHLGPEGNYLRDFGPYFTDRYRTPWGEAVNLDGPDSDHVRRFFVENALFWFREYHVDALRVDAIHAIVDTRATQFFAEFTAAADEFSLADGRRRYCIAESNLNDTRVIRTRDQWGHGFDAVWCDDVHHAIHTLLTGERDGYYMDFGLLKDLAAGLQGGFVYAGQHSPFRRRRHGVPSGMFPPHRFVVFSQNHDQIGNRMRGERLSTLVPFEALKLAAGLVILSPYLPLLFMGEEYGEEAPFPFFVSHGDPALVEAVRRGRAEEFEEFEWQGEPPDPQDPDTYRSAILRWERSGEGRHALLLSWYRRLLQVRRALPAIRDPERKTGDLMIDKDSRCLVWRRGAGSAAVVLVFHVAPGEASLPGGLPPGLWHKSLDSSDPSWGGAGMLAPENLKGGTPFTVAPHQTLLFVQKVNG